MTDIELHLTRPSARIARSMRSFERIRGWHRLVNWLVPEGVTGEFLVWNLGLKFAGSISSFIDRQIYLFGNYEGEQISEFLRFMADRPRRVLLDVGANAGTHSLSFANQFGTVHAFEPNPALWPQFERNMAINGFTNVTLHKVGLAAADDELPFYAIESTNRGLGTFLSDEQYDKPLQCIGRSRIVHGDVYLQARGIEPVDAIKIDVQGYEPLVLQGLAETIRKFRPVIWFEYGAGTRLSSSREDPRTWFPIEVDLLRIASIKRGLMNAVCLIPTDKHIPLADYLAVPRRA